MSQYWLQSWWPTPYYRHVALEGLIALCLAFIVWLYLHSRARENIDQVQIPVQVQLAAGHRDQYALEIPGTPRVTASFFGSTSRIRELRRKLQRGQVKVTIDYAIADGRQQDASFSDVVRVEPGHVVVPPGVTAELVEATRAIPLTVHRLSERSLPVKLEYTGEARITQIKIEPASVLVRGPKGVLDRAVAITTQPYAFTVLPDENGDPVVKDQATLVNELEGHAVQVTPPHVVFRCKVTPKKRLYELRDVAVHFLCPAQFPWRPRFADERQGKVALRLIGPTGDEPPPVLAYIDLTKGTFGRGRNLEPLRLQLPKDFQLADNTPPLVAFQLEELERVAATEVDPKLTKPAPPKPIPPQPVQPEPAPRTSDASAP
ncbi:MAG: hypothetical protein L0Y71_03365 [Gemmataceae bacterium]|nr:hypothetical protein [Gemmataceae bacterium]